MDARFKIREVNRFLGQITSLAHITNARMLRTSYGCSRELCLGDL